MTDTTKIVLGVVGGIAVLGVLYLALKPATPTTDGSFTEDARDTHTHSGEPDDTGNAVSGVSRAVADITRTIAGVITSDRDREATRERERLDREERRHQDREAREERLLILRNGVQSQRNNSGRDPASFNWSTLTG